MYHAASAAPVAARCDSGPVLVVYPDAVWYSYVDNEDIEEIIQERRDRLIPKTARGTGVRNRVHVHHGRRYLGGGPSRPLSVLRSWLWTSRIRRVAVKPSISGI